MGKAKQSYRDIRKMFVGTSHGNILLALTVGGRSVHIQAGHMIKGTVPIDQLESSSEPHLLACKEAHPEAFKAYVEEVNQG